MAAPSISCGVIRLHSIATANQTRCPSSVFNTARGTMRQGLASTTCCTIRRLHTTATPHHILRDPSPLPGPPRVRPSTRRHAIHTPFPHASHITPTPNTSSIELYGNYRITGPARIFKVGDSLIARLAPMGYVDAMEGGTCDTLSSETLECDEEEPCSLIAEHIELHGEFVLVSGVDRVDPEAVQGVHALDGKTVLTVRLLPDNTQIVLEAGAQLNHPVNMRR